MVTEQTRVLNGHPCCNLRIYPRFLLQLERNHGKTQNSGLCSKEEKAQDPINEPSRCHMQERLLSVAQLGDSDLLGDRAPQQQIWPAFIGKNHIISILYMDYKATGYNIIHTM